MLLVDDDALQARIRQAILENAGFDIRVATTPEAALELARAAKADGGFGAIVTDHLLPGMNGAELVRKIRDLMPEVPVIVITGLPDAEVEYQGLNVHFRQKPCPPPELIELVRVVTRLTD